MPYQYEYEQDATKQRTCHDCGAHLLYHEWMELRCTLDEEDTTQAYCQTCFVHRMAKYLTGLGYIVSAKPMA